MPVPEYHYVRDYENMSGSGRRLLCAFGHSEEYSQEHNVIVKRILYENTTNYRLLESRSRTYSGTGMK